MRKKKRVGLATKVFVTVFAVYAAFTLVSLQIQISGKKSEQDELSAQYEQQQIINAELEGIVSGERKEEIIASIAQDSLDYIYPGTKIYKNISSK